MINSRCDHHSHRQARHVLVLDASRVIRACEVCWRRVKRICAEEGYGYQVVMKS